MMIARGIDNAARILALGGGVVLIAIVLLTTLDVVLGKLFSAPFSGTYELVVIGAGIAVFAFLPYAQIERAHVRVNFAARFMPEWMRRVVDAMISLAFSGLAGLLIWRMSLGATDYYRYGETTPILGIPLWWAFGPVLVSLFFWALAAFVGFLEELGVIPARKRAHDE